MTEEELIIEATPIGHLSIHQIMMHVVESRDATFIAGVIQYENAKFGQMEMVTCFGCDCNMEYGILELCEDVTDYTIALNNMVDEDYDEEDEDDDDDTEGDEWKK